MVEQKIYQCYAELEGFSPTIWRRFQIKCNITTAQFSYAVMIMFEMLASHLFHLESQNECIYRLT